MCRDRILIKRNGKESTGQKDSLIKQDFDEKFLKERHLKVKKGINVRRQLLRPRGLKINGMGN